ncbi:hypothetical protein [Dickeya dianthicola]|uniref:hypothetical protein n=1 Tax=Dickeya dianthicola TaxID=204039 RepID=UPI001369333D|nr:hypothetical protein [Dickeya dianthicola]MCI4239184.1 hypothetical protein [Dickeya dianthicola]MCI4253358.1 hypothetical protein [Dickeya dianthicola]
MKKPFISDSCNFMTIKPGSQKLKNAEIPFNVFSGRSPAKAQRRRGLALGFVEK